MKLMPMTMKAMAMPGKNAHHQLPRMSWPWDAERPYPS